MKAFFQKQVNSTLAPANQESEEYISKLKIGDGVSVEIKKVRNYEFLKKYFALLDFAYDQWEPEERTYKGQVVAKNREKFRSDIQILSGYGVPVINIKGESRIVSKSISFAKMNDESFGKLYSAACDVILSNVLKNYTQEELDNIMNELLGFM